jgi:hypothetical protein
MAGPGSLAGKVGGPKVQNMFASVAIDLGGMHANLNDMESMDLSSSESFARHMKANYPTGADGRNAYNDAGMVDVDVSGINAKLGRLQSVDVDLDDDFGDITGASAAVNHRLAQMRGQNKANADRLASVEVEDHIADHLADRMGSVALDDDDFMDIEVDIPDFNIAFEHIPEAERARLDANLDHHLDASDIEKMKAEIGSDMAGMEASLDKLLNDMDDIFLQDD